MPRLIMIILAACVVLGAANPKPSKVEIERRIAAADADLNRFISPTLKRFSGEAEFLAFAAAVKAAERARYQYSSAKPGLHFAQATTTNPTVQSDATEVVCPKENPDCQASADADDAIVVTGSRVVVSNPSITNNQMKNVEEGDIVKQINHYLLILQNGRIFVADIQASKAGKIELADRINAYLDSADDAWYDEMLVFGDRVLITGYSYRDDATLLAVFRLSERGKLSREGRFLLSSNDYYSSNNYATRLIGDNLVIYTPFDIDGFVNDRSSWPVVRRWIAEGDKKRAADERRFFDAKNIFRPVQPGAYSTVHTVSVCPLGEASADRNLDCRTTGFVGPRASEWYVTDEAAFLWTVKDTDGDRDRDCRAGEKFAIADLTQALAYMIPIGGSPVRVAAARGEPFDQFSMLSTGGRFRALLKAAPATCWFDDDDGLQPKYLDIPVSSFAPTVSQLPDDRYTSLPAAGSGWVANRFSDKYLVYGGLSRWRRGLPVIDPDWDPTDSWVQRYKEDMKPRPVYVVPLDNPAGVTSLDIRHTLIRLDLAGENMVTTGYRNRTGLQVSLIDLRKRPHVASTQLLENRFESEGRSHAFNSRIETDGSGVMGLPTVPRLRGDERYSWRSSASDVSFLTVNSKGTLKPAGDLLRKLDYDDATEGGIKGAECEVSCVDWYGNSRPIFTGGRIFALTGAELVEGRLDKGEIYEVRRLNVALTTPRR